MAELDAITKILQVGTDAVLLVLLYYVYRDFIMMIREHRAFMERLVDRLLPADEPPPVLAYRPPPPNGVYQTRTPTNLGEP